VQSFQHKSFSATAARQQQQQQQHQQKYEQLQQQCKNYTLFFSLSICFLFLFSYCFFSFCYAFPRSINHSKHNALYLKYAHKCSTYSSKMLGSVFLQFSILSSSIFLLPIFLFLSLLLRSSSLSCCFC